MNTVLVILITWFAVLGAYFVADMLAGGGDKPYNAAALLVLPQNTDVSDVVELALALRGILPQCEIIAANEKDGGLPVHGCGFDAITFAEKQALGDAAGAWLHLHGAVDEL